MAKFWATVAVITVLLWANIFVFALINRRLEDSCTPRAQQLEFVSDPSIARSIVDDWSTPDVRGWAAAGILADFPFIGIYVLLLIVLLRRCAGLLPQIASWRPAGLKLIGAAIAAGALDFIENLGMLAELYLRWFALAPFVAIAALLKFILIGLVTLYIVLSFLLWIRARAAKNDEQLSAEVGRFI